MSHERLTTQSECFDGATLKAFCESCGEDDCRDFCSPKGKETNCEECPVQEALDRLAQYEDSGLLPEDIKWLIDQNSQLLNRIFQCEGTSLKPKECSEFAKAKVEGRLVILPCKVGDTIYWVDTEIEELYINDGIIANFYIDDANGKLWAYVRYSNGLRFQHLVDGYFGKTVFLTREEAKVALMQKEEGAE